MTETDKQAVLNVINSLWAHDPLKWGNTCASLVNNEIDFDAPAIVTELGGEYVTAIVTMIDGREFEIGYVLGGWYMGYVKPGNPKTAIAQEEKRRLKCQRIMIAGQ